MLASRQTFDVLHVLRQAVQQDSQPAFAYWPLISAYFLLRSSLQTKTDLTICRLPASNLSEFVNCIRIFVQKLTYWAVHRAIMTEVMQTEVGP